MNESDSSKYQEFLGYMFRFYLTENHKYDIPHQDHFTDIINGYMDGTSNASENINRSLKSFQLVAPKVWKLFSEVFITSKLATENECCAQRYNEKTKKTIDIFDKINEILSEFDDLQPDLQISSLVST